MRVSRLTTRASCIGLPQVLGHDSVLAPDSVAWELQVRRDSMHSLIIAPARGCAVGDGATNGGSTAEISRIPRTESPSGQTWLQSNPNIIFSGALAALIALISTREAQTA